MDNLFYMLGMKISGIKNIKKEVCLEFYKKTIDKSFDPDRYRIKAIYGENGSGKSAIISAVKIFQDIILNNNYLSDSNTQSILREIINKETQVFKFNCEYIVEMSNARAVYSYTLHIGLNNNVFEIQYEKLMKKNGNYPNNNYQVIFESVDGELKEVAVGDLEKEYIIKKTYNLLSSHSMITLCFENLNKGEQDKKLDDRYVEFILNIIVCMVFAMCMKVYLEEGDQHELYFLRKKINESGFDKKSIDDRLLEIIESKAMAYNISERRVEKAYFEKYEEMVLQLTEFLKIFKPALVKIDIDKREDGEHYLCELILDYGGYRVNKEFESTGIKKLIRLFDCFLAASRTGIVFVDELDSNLNDVYLCKLIEYFMYYGKGQLCFTTHNLDPMSILKENKNSIDFLSNENTIVPWTTRGNSSPDNCYRNGLIEDLPFNVDATDFIGIFGE